MLSIQEINLLQAQNEGLKKQNKELQKELTELELKHNELLKTLLLLSKEVKNGEKNNV